MLLACGCSAEKRCGCLEYAADGAMDSTNGEKFLRAMKQEVMQAAKKILHPLHPNLP
jgi:hypothetical protein